MIRKVAELVNPLEAEFPVVLEKGIPKALIVDFTVFQRLKILLDNLLNREPEPEDALIAASESFQKLLSSVKTEPSSNWRKELYEI
jgi:hypothetical protein